MIVTHTPLTDNLLMYPTPPRLHCLTGEWKYEMGWVMRFSMHSDSRRSSTHFPLGAPCLESSHVSRAPVIAHDDIAEAIGSVFSGWRGGGSKWEMRALGMRSMSVSSSVLISFFHPPPPPPLSSVSLMTSTDPR
ncbi:hypothetical protein L249_0444, partial [Ophiocordyceps polyrhachis-furcata BCC 54312]